MIKFYNTLSRKKEDFKALKEEVRIYSCGPTVYWHQTIGNLRAYVFVDILKRVLKYNGYNVRHIINVTDVGHLTSDADTGEDKLELASKKEGKKAEDIAKFYFNEFVGDIKKLNIGLPWKWTWATDHIKEQIDLIKKLEKKGFTYRTSDGIYFNSKKFKNYGKLAKLNIKNLKAGKRVGIGEKMNKTDFALWKFSQENRQQEWESPWGVGFPGWHIECSAMSMKYLGEHFDIHTGGEDHIPVHHENEIAQSESATGKKYVNYWIHNAFLVDEDGKKISKSKGRLYTLSELEKLGYKPEHFRYSLLLTHYRKQMKFSLENLDSAKNAYERLRKKIIEIKKEKHRGVKRSYEDDFLKAINDDLNTSKALDILWKVIDDFDLDSTYKIKMLEKFDEVLGLNIRKMKEEKIKISPEIKKLIDDREKLRAEKKYAEADIIRRKIFEKGFIVEDSEKGSSIRRAV